MYQALAQSLNLPAVWLLHEIGLDRGYSKAQEFGLSLTESDKYYGLALGGLEKGESPMTMAAAYGVFANGGYYYKPHLITKIVDSTGAVIVDNTSVQGKRVISKETADKMTSMMLGTFSNGRVLVPVRTALRSPARQVRQRPTLMLLRSMTNGSSAILLIWFFQLG